MKTDRLTALRRQRALVAEHLAWLDAEIIALTPFETSLVEEPAAPPGGGSHSPSVAPLPPDALAAANARADEIIANYAATERLDPASARKGCLQLALAFGLISIAGILAVYLIYY